MAKRVLFSEGVDSLMICRRNIKVEKLLRYYFGEHTVGSCILILLQFSAI